MTRINCGIDPKALCDQHLIAEYRELPRMVRFSHTQKTIPDVPFTLNTGHMKSCVRYGSYLSARHAELIREMRRRGFAPRMRAITASMFPAQCRNQPDNEWLNQAARIVSARINERLRTMKRKPTHATKE